MSEPVSGWIYWINQEICQSLNNEVTEKIIGSAMKVHAALGNGFHEVIYQRALEIEMKDAGLNFVREFSMPVYYKHQQIGERRVDFLLKKK